MADLPPYSYVPGGPWPHPRSGSGGHSFGRPPDLAPAIEPDAWDRSAFYVRGVELFNAGYYWEAHEALESLWHAHGRRGPIADLLKALIKLAAAGVKVREGQPRGVVTHAGRAHILIEGLRRDAGERLLGLDLAELSAFASAVRDNPPADPGHRGAAVTRVFAEELRVRPEREWLGNG